MNIYTKIYLSLISVLLSIYKVRKKKPNENQYKLMTYTYIKHIVWI